MPAAREPIRFERITTGHFNTSFYVYTPDAELVMRIAPPHDSVFLFYERNMMRQEPHIHALLRERTGVPVAPILLFDDTHELIDRDYMLMQRLPGWALSDMGHLGQDLADGVLRQVGRHLAQAHALTAGHYGYLGAHHPMEPQAAWVRAFAVMWDKLIDDIVSVGHYDENESRMLRHLLQAHRALFDRAVPASLLHMDIWSQNILVDARGNVTGLVDWDRSLWGDPEIEFAVLDYCGISEPAFWEGYGSERDRSQEAEVRRVFYLLYELQKYIVIEQGRRHNAAGAQRYKRQVMQIVSKVFG
jgi:aminoglycoside phosphotransferase (APT) family kinase protein